MFKACWNLPFLIGGGIHPLCLKSDYSDNMDKGVEFEVQSTPHTDLRATQKKLEMCSNDKSTTHVT